MTDDELKELSNDMAFHINDDKLLIYINDKYDCEIEKINVETVLFDDEVKWFVDVKIKPITVVHYIENKITIKKTSEPLTFD